MPSQTFGHTKGKWRPQVTLHVPACRKPCLPALIGPSSRVQVFCWQAYRVSLCWGTGREQQRGKLCDRRGRGARVRAAAHLVWHLLGRERAPRAGAAGCLTRRGCLHGGLLTARIACLQAGHLVIWSQATT